MSFSINTNVGALAALQSLNATQESLNNTQNVISSGLLVGSASDNPAVYSISQTLQANISGLTAVQDNISFANSVLGVAAAAGSQISSQLATLQNTVTQAQQTGINQTTMNTQISNILKNIDNFANNATFNGVNLLASSSDAGVNFTYVNIQDSINAGGQLQVKSQLTGSNTSMTGQLGLTNLTASAGGAQFSFSSSYSPKAGDYLQIATNSVNASGTTLTNNYVFEFQTAGATSGPVAAPSGFTLGATSTGTNTLINVMMSSTTSPMAAVGSLISSLQQQGFAASLSNSGALTITGNGLAMSGSGSSAIAEAAFQGIGTATAPVAFAAGALVTADTGTAGEAGVTGTTLSGGQAAITIVQNAVTTMNGIAATIGANQQEVTGMLNFTNSLSTSLTTGNGALIDANMASESAQLNALQTKQQLAIRTLSIANAQPQVLLNLFQ